MGKTKIKKAQPVVPRPSRTPRTPPAEPSDADGSTYQCEICFSIDFKDKVCCDECHLWFHFTCVNVTSDVENQYWACAVCEKIKQKRTESTPNKKDAEVPSNPVSVAENIVIGPVVSRADNSALIDLEPNIVNPSIIGQNVNKSTKSRKSSSTSSSVSRKTTLALQRLEEEKELSEKRDAEYLAKKYSLLAEDLESEPSSDDEEVQQAKHISIQKWTDEMPDRFEGINELSRISLTEAHPPTSSTSAVATKNPIIQPRWSTIYNRSENQSSRAKIPEKKKVDPVLPLWLTAPSTEIPNIFPWKVPPSVSQTANTSVPVSSTTVSLLKSHKDDQRIGSSTMPLVSQVPLFLSKEQLEATVAVNAQSKKAEIRTSVLNTQKMQSTTNNYTATSTILDNRAMSHHIQPGSSTTLNNPSMSAVSQPIFSVASTYSRPVMSNKQSFQPKSRQTFSNEFGLFNGRPTHLAHHQFPMTNDFQSVMDQQTTCVPQLQPNFIRTCTQAQTTAIPVFSRNTNNTFEQCSVDDN